MTTSLSYQELQAENRDSASQRTLLEAEAEICEKDEHGVVIERLKIQHTRTHIDGSQYQLARTGYALSLLDELQLETATQLEP